MQNPRALQLVTSQDKAIKLGLSSQIGADGQAQFVGKLQLQYTIPNSDEAQLTAWKELPYYKMRPQAEQTVFHSSIRVFVEPHALDSHLSKIGNTTAIPGQYQILLGSYEATATVDVLQVLNNALATPFTLAADRFACCLVVKSCNCARSCWASSSASLARSRALTSSS